MDWVLYLQSCKVIFWSFRKQSRIVEDFLFSIEQIIKEADDPQAFGEAAGIKKEIQCLEEKYEKRKEKMTSNDKNKLDELFKNKSY